MIQKFYKPRDFAILSTSLLDFSDLQLYHIAVHFKTSLFVTLQLFYTIN